jgi:hypothetical protein
MLPLLPLSTLCARCQECERRASGPPRKGTGPAAAAHARYAHAACARRRQEGSLLRLHERAGRAGARAGILSTRQRHSLDGSGGYGWCREG